jgi:hypothetical protein
MVVGYGIINLRIPECGTLKDKRSVLSRIIKRAQNEFNVTIAETGHQDNHHFAEIGFALVGNESRYISGKADHLLNFIGNMHVAEILNSSVEIMVVSSFLEQNPGERNEYDEL